MSHKDPTYENLRVVRYQDHESRTQKCEKDYLASLQTTNFDNFPEILDFLKNSFFWMKMTSK